MGNELMRDVHAFTPNDGEMAFWWLGQLGYIVKTKRAVLCFDPYLRPDDNRLVPPLVTPEELTGIDYIFGSHDHIDHIDRYAWERIAESSPKTCFVLPEALVESIGSDLKIDSKRLIGLDEGRVFNDAEKGMRVSAIASAHEFLSRDAVTDLYDCIGFVVDIEQLRIYHSGDNCKYEGLETKLMTLRPIDLMFLPINGRDAERYSSGCIGNMNFAEAVDLAGTVAPGLIVPGHYDMFSNNSEDPLRFMQYLAVKYPGQRAWVGGHGQRIMLSNIPETR